MNNIKAIQTTGEGKRGERREERGEISVEGAGWRPKIVPKVDRGIERGTENRGTDPRKTAGKFLYLCERNEK